MQDSGSIRGCFDSGIKQKLNVCRTTSLSIHNAADYILKKPEFPSLEILDCVIKRTIIIEARGLK